MIKVEPVARALQLRLHLDRIEGHLHRHECPDARITVFGADRAGIVAQVTEVLSAEGFNILDLESDVAGTTEEPVYIMQIAGITEHPVESIDAAMADLRKSSVDILTLGQYLRPAGSSLELVRYVTPAEFDAYRSRALEMG